MKDKKSDTATTTTSKRKSQTENSPAPTIVGGRPPENSSDLQSIPHGIEILVKKASVDEDFKKLLLTERAGAAKHIGLALQPAEEMMLTSATEAQLNLIISNTRMPPQHVPIFRGSTAAAMIAALGIMTSTLVSSGDESGSSKGIRPEGVFNDEKPRIEESVAPDGHTETSESNRLLSKGILADPVRPNSRGIQPDPVGPISKGILADPVRPNSRGIQPDVPSPAVIRPEVVSETPRTQVVELLRSWYPQKALTKDKSLESILGKGCPLNPLRLTLQEQLGVQLPEKDFNQRMQQGTLEDLLLFIESKKNER